MKIGWLDVRLAAEPALAAVLEAAVHARLDGVVHNRPEVLATLPPTVRRVLLPDNGFTPADLGGIDLLLTPVSTADQVSGLSTADNGDPQCGAFVEVVDQTSLDVACLAAATLPWTVVSFSDPTRIPLEIVIAAGDRNDGRVMSFVNDDSDAEISLTTLQKGSDGVVAAAREPAAVARLTEVLSETTPGLQLSTLTVRGIEHLGVGHRVCIDTCTKFALDEGMLIGSFAHGFILCVSETHPLPYMPTRPFRVNAGALHSYVLGVDNRTNYLSELRAGHTLLAVDTKGRTRKVVVGRAKIEQRPLLGIQAVSDSGIEVNLIVQDDWHVRVLGPGAVVLNVTELKAGAQVLGYLVDDQRHVGWPIDEFCVEQ